MRLKVEKERLNGEMKKIESTGGVSKAEYNRVKRQAELLKKRMSVFAMAIKTGQAPFPMASMSDLSLGGCSPRKVTSDMSLGDLSEINRRLDQIEVDQIKHNKIFKENQS